MGGLPRTRRGSTHVRRNLSRAPHPPRHRPAPAARTCAGFPSVCSPAQYSATAAPRPPLAQPQTPAQPARSARPPQCPPTRPVPGPGYCAGKRHHDRRWIRPTGLTAKARPEARPGRRAANSHGPMPIGMTGTFAHSTYWRIDVEKGDNRVMECDAIKLGGSVDMIIALVLRPRDRG